jgi:SAM-dependent methyltransferase
LPSADLPPDLAAALAARSAMQDAMWADIANVSARLAWPELRRRFIDAVARDFSRWVGADQSHFREQLLFAAGRFDEGAALLRYFALQDSIRPARILDIGAGNGGVAYALANCRDFEVHTLDIVPNNELLALRSALELPVRALVASGDRIPLGDETLDVVLLIDTLEHLPDPRAVGREIMRVLRPGGCCVITTPARVPHLFRPDPHYGIPFLAMLPNEVQRFVVDRVFRRRPRYDVEHLFWSVREIERVFPGAARTEVLFNRGYNPPPGLRHAMRHPSTLRELVAYKLRRFFYDRVLIYK